MTNYLLKRMLYATLAIICINVVFAQGPNAPEAAGFEPVDATDMVNLVTGDFTYVLPLLNVPSPEGGYPIALSYHAGIAMDQEASWVGLGWNVNPGAINRSINGYPDDYNNALLSEFFYDSGDEQTVYHFSIGYGHEGLSVGLGFSWGSHKSLGGTVSIGIGPDTGNDEFGPSIGVSVGEKNSVNVGYFFKSGLSLGLNSDGIFSVGFDTNSAGFSISSNGTASFRKNHQSGNGNTFSTGITLSSNGIGIMAGATNKTGNNVDGGLGVGLSLQFENTVSMGDYTTQTSGWMIPISIPTNIGVFSLTFGKQKFKYWLGKNVYNYISGPIHFNKNASNSGQWIVECFFDDWGYHTNRCGSSQLASSLEQAKAIASKIEGDGSRCRCAINQIEVHEAFMDVYEVALNSSDNGFSSTTEIDFDNPVFPSYDNYTVQAQGLSGGMSSRLFENGNLFGLSNKENDQGYKLSFGLDGSAKSIPKHAKFDGRPYFYFDNEISSYIAVREASFNTNSNASILKYYTSGVDDDPKSRRRNAAYVEYYTVKDLQDNYNTAKSQGYLMPFNSGFSFHDDYLPVDGIAAFKVTSTDGKTYHYSLPVYNHEIVTRTHGVTDRKLEHQSYFEKRQLEPYATHWLLTAVTGPDYYDKNNNAVADKGDYGYWVAFEYGKWSDAFGWKTPYGKDYFESAENPGVKTKITGRKQVYYLDRIKTRTHNAIFIKSQREDALSYRWEYRSAIHKDRYKQSYRFYKNMPNRFTLPTQKSLRLDKIILVKEDKDVLSKSRNRRNSFVDVHYNESSKPSQRAGYNLEDNVIDSDDHWGNLLNDAIKVIDFNYDYSLAEGTPNKTTQVSGRLSLKSVDFKGKKGSEVMPPYKFDYLNPTYQFDIGDKDSFGYYKNNNSIWSLNEISTPTGGKIDIGYQTHQLETVYDSRIAFTSYYENDYKAVAVTEDPREQVTFDISSTHDVGIEVGDQVPVQFTVLISIGPGPLKFYYYNGSATVLSDLENNRFRLKTNGPGQAATYKGEKYLRDLGITIGFYYSLSGIPKIKASVSAKGVQFEIGGIRVSDLILKDNEEEYKTVYKYGKDENGMGHISYLPDSPETDEELPYSTELPAPKVMYEYVAVEPVDRNNESLGKTQYKFKVFKEKDPNSIKYGDLYEIETTVNKQHYNAVAKKQVKIKNYKIHDNLATLGHLLEVSTFNKEGHQLSKLVNTYYSPNDPTPENVGITQEAYQSYKVVDYTDTNKTDKWLVNSSSRVKYPSLLKSSTSYKSGYRFNTTFGNLDKITGQALEVINTNSKGTRLRTEAIPAYTLSAYGTGAYSMGSKVDHSTNKNMLVQNAMTKTSLEIGGKWKEIGVGITTWNNDWDYTTIDGTSGATVPVNQRIWRKHKTFVWDGTLNYDGTLSRFSGEDDNFQWGINAAQTNPKWKNVSTISMYDHYSKPLEVRDINNNYATTKMTDGDSKVSFVCNARYGESFYTGAESKLVGPYLDQQIKMRNNTTVSNTYAHTGTKSIKIPNGSYLNIEFKHPYHRTGKYKVSVWVKKDNATNTRIGFVSAPNAFNGEKVYAGDWVQLNHYLDINQTSYIYITTASGTIYVDDVRVHPVSSSMTSYVYNEWDELSHIIGNNGLATQYEYDSAGRLAKTYTEVADFEGAGSGGFKISSEHTHNYKK